VTHWVIDAIKQHLPGVTDVVVHTEPAGIGQRSNPMPEGALVADAPPAPTEAEK
jgi:hypothetical protein